MVMTSDESSIIGKITKEYGGFFKEFTKSDVFSINCKLFFNISLE